MRQVVALLGLLYVAVNLLAAYLFVTSGLAAKMAAKGMLQQGLLLSGGLLIGLFALFLAWQCVALALSRERATS
ncbi:MAG TPA: hypothetical protein VFH48_45165 [Chloroflexota bacterium]|nr:hypothetical protein [Chloroflexota bacterium]